MATFKILVSATVSEDWVYFVEAATEQEAMDKQAEGEETYDVTETWTSEETLIDVEPYGGK